MRIFFVIIAFLLCESQAQIWKYYDIFENGKKSVTQVKLSINHGFETNYNDDNTLSDGNPYMYISSIVFGNLFGFNVRSNTYSSSDSSVGADAQWHKLILIDKYSKNLIITRFAVDYCKTNSGCRWLTLTLKNKNTKKCQLIQYDQNNHEIDIALRPCQDNEIESSISGTWEGMDKETVYDIKWKEKLSINLNGIEIF